MVLWVGKDQLGDLILGSPMWLQSGRSWSWCWMKPQLSEGIQDGFFSHTPGVSLASLSFSRLHFILQSPSTKLGLLLAVILLHWLPSQKVEAARPGNGYSQNCLSIRQPYAIGQSHDMVCPDSRVWGERFYLLKLMKSVWDRKYYCRHLWKIQSTTTNYLKKKAHTPPWVRKISMRLIISQRYDMIVRKTNEIVPAKVRSQNKENQQVFCLLHWWNHIQKEEYVHG